MHRQSHLFDALLLKRKSSSRSLSLAVIHPLAKLHRRVCRFAARVSEHRAGDKDRSRVLPITALVTENETMIAISFLPSSQANNSMWYCFSTKYVVGVLALVATVMAAANLRADVGVGAKPIAGAEILLDGSRRCSTRSGPTGKDRGSPAKLPIQWKLSRIQSTRARWSARPTLRRGWQVRRSRYRDQESLSRFSIAC